MQNFFSLFGIEEKVDIDLDLLDESYFTLLANVHPDTAKSLSVPYDAMLINKGYNILKDEFERIVHILELHSFFIKDDVKAPKLPAEILEYIIDLSEKSTEEIQEVLEHLKESVSKLILNKNYEEAAAKMLEIHYIRKISSESINF